MIKNEGNSLSWYFLATLLSWLWISLWKRRNVIMQHTAAKAWLLVAEDWRTLHIRMLWEKGEIKKKNREREREKWVKEKNIESHLGFWNFGLQRICPCDGWGEGRRQGWPGREEVWAAELGYPDQCSSSRIDSDESPDPESDGSTDVSQ